MDPVIYLVERSNQRGGRMLSVVDLIEAGTLDRALASWLLERILGGASWMVGAVPGGAGKTTIMSALLAMLPEGETVRLANRDTRWHEAGPGTCVVAYELSPGFYDGYVWGEDIVRLADLAAQGVRVVTNLHADTLAQARQQIVDQNGASPDGFDCLDMFLPVSVRRGLAGWRRTVSGVRFYDGDWRCYAHVRPEATSLREAIDQFLGAAMRDGVRLVTDVRPAWLRWCRTNNVP